MAASQRVADGLFLAPSRRRGVIDRIVFRLPDWAVLKPLVRFDGCETVGVDGLFTTPSGDSRSTESVDRCESIWADLDASSSSQRHSKSAVMVSHKSRLSDEKSAHWRHEKHIADKLPTIRQMNGWSAM